MKRQWYLKRQTKEISGADAVRVDTQGPRSWSGSCYATTLAIIFRVADGWRFNNVVYPSLLQAVRAWKSATRIPKGPITREMFAEAEKFCWHGDGNGHQRGADHLNAALAKLAN